MSANSREDADDANATQKDSYGRGPTDSGVLIDTGVPDSGSVYADNGLPQQDIWKTRNGHKFVMSHKITKARHNNSILYQTAGGKFLRLDDGPPELAMDRITLSDEKKNRFQIITGGVRPNMALLETRQDQEFTSLEGAQYQTVVTGSGDQIRDNMGKGDIRDHVHQANHITTAYVDINRTSHTGDIFELL